MRAPSASTLLLAAQLLACRAQTGYEINAGCGTELATKVTVGSQTEVLSPSSSLDEGGEEQFSCSDVNPGYSGIITLSCGVINAQWGGSLSANATQCQCLNPYAVGTDSYFCHKYKYCYQKQGDIGNPVQCRYDCSEVPGWEEAVAAWDDADVAAMPYNTDFSTREVSCHPNCVDGSATTRVVRVDQPHAGHVPSSTWENDPTAAGEVESGGHCLPFEVTDFDECVSEAGHTHTCDTNADCTNTIGSFTCACRAAFEGDGYTCADRAGCLEGKCFNVITVDAVFDVADANCQGMYPASASSSDQGGNLASIHSLAEQEFMFAMILDADVIGDYWLGLRQDAEFHPWWWTDGTSFDYAKWIAPDPDNLPDQMCGLTRNNPANSKHNNWFDLGCDSMHPYVCQYYP